MAAVREKKIADMGVIELKQARARKFTELRGMVDVAERANRDLTDAEQRTYDATGEEIRQIDRRLGNIANLKAMAQRQEDSSSIEARHMESARRLAQEFRDIAEGSSLGASVTFTDFQDTYIWDRLVPQTVALKANPTIITTERKSITLPVLSADAAAGWYAEGAAISEADPTGSDLVVTPTKLASLTYMSREAADDSTPSLIDYVTKNLTRSIGLAFDLGFFQGTGTSNQITGLASTSGITVQSQGTNGASFTSLDPLITALATLEGANADMSRAVIVMHSSAYAQLAKLKDSQNRPLLDGITNGSASPRSLNGVPILTSNQLSVTETQGTSSATGSAYVFDASQCIVVRSHELRVEISRDFKFQTDQIALRAVMRVGLAVPNPAAVVRVKGIILP